MIDGFSGPFCPDNLARRHPERQSFYLHLHGSPLYVTGDAGEVRKSALAEIGDIQGHQSVHLVLTAVHHKPTVIASSPVLRTYWECLDRALEESQGVTIVGYGGVDTHLNQLIYNHRENLRIRVVERITGETPEDSERRWRSVFGNYQLEVLQLANVLDFRNW
ncbi:hypothetical protein [Rhodovulum marinum]|uniref:hypothetical protein n=1 Tax=Rhodovulum marinum TaxID=320662 RepID=UPI001046B0A1|nr:hypothetical protein [Rhodovulum marinum]